MPTANMAEDREHGGLDSDQADSNGERAVISAASIAHLVREHGGEDVDSAALLRQAQAVSFYIFLDVVQEALEQDVQPWDVPFRPTNRHWLRSDLGIKTDAEGEAELLRRLHGLGVIRLEETEAGPRLWLAPAICVRSEAATRLNWNVVGNTWVPSDYIFRLVLLDHLDPAGALSRVAKSTLLEHAGMSRSALKRALSREADKEIITRAYANQNELLLAWGPRALVRNRRADSDAEGTAESPWRTSGSDADAEVPRAAAADMAQTVTFHQPVRIEVPTGASVATVGIDSDGIKRYRVALADVPGELPAADTQLPISGDRTGAVPGAGERDRQGARPAGSDLRQREREEGSRRF